MNTGQKTIRRIITVMMVRTPAVPTQQQRSLNPKMHPQDARWDARTHTRGFTSNLKKWHGGVNTTA